MGYLNNSVITVDAILTTKGRQLLAQNNGSFRITQFALADDEVNYTLYNPDHPSGSAYYGEAIVNMPLLEAFPLETQIMKYKLTTLPRGTAKMPILDLGYSSIVIKQGASLAITPQTLNYFGGNTYETAGYTFTISDVRLFNTFEGVGINTPSAQALNTTTTLGTSVSKTVVGTTLNLRATTVNTLFGSNTQLQATLMVEGRDSGARLTIPVTVTKIS
tara:strand:+ start:1370 stop:2023 length:654 start_codon:yes stop_codon:yes gene_type:complete